MRHFCDNRLCDLHEYKTDLHTMYIDISNDLSFSRKFVRNHEYVDMYGAPWYFCDTCHNACQMLDKRTRRA